jgi:hypothetical protein
VPGNRARLHTHGGDDRHIARIERRAQRTQQLVSDRRKKLGERDLEPLNPAVAPP